MPRSYPLPGSITGGAYESKKFLFDQLCGDLPEGIFFIIYAYVTTFISRFIDSMKLGFGQIDGRINRQTDRFSDLDKCNRNANSTTLILLYTLFIDSLCAYSSMKQTNWAAVSRWSHITCLGENPITKKYLISSLISPSNLVGIFSSLSGVIYTTSWQSESI